MKKTWKWRARIYRRALEAASRSRVEMGRELHRLRLDVRSLRKRLVEVRSVRA